MPSFLDAITPKAASYAMPKGTPFVSRQQSIGGYDVPDAGLLRQWASTMPFVGAAIQLRVDQVATGDWDIVPKDPDAAFSEKTQAQVIATLDAPNPNFNNNSFAGLVGPVTRDIVTVGVGAVLPLQAPKGDLQLVVVDGGLVKFLPDWQTRPDKCRYFLGDPKNPQYGWLLRNDQLITITPYATSFDDIGTPPLRSLHRFLTAEMDWFKSVHAIQKHRSLGGLLNLAGATDEQMRGLRRRLVREIESNHSFALTNLELDEVSFTPIAGIDLKQQGAFEFYNILILACCAAFQVSALDVQWMQNVKYDSAEEESAFTQDHGIKPLLGNVGSWLSREFVPRFGDPNLRFSWPELESDSAPEPVEMLVAKLQGGIASRADVAIAAGEEPPERTGDDALDAWNFDRMTVVAPGGVLAPISVAAKMPAFQPMAGPAAVPAGDNEPTTGAVEPTTEERGTVDEKPAERDTTDPQASKRLTKALTPEQEMQAGEDTMIAELDQMFTQVWRGKA